MGSEMCIRDRSMSATSSLLLAEHNPGFYNAVGSFSGCASTSRPLPRLYTQLTVNRGGGSADQMWGAMGSEYNVYNDALVNANPNNLGKSETYVSVNSGLGGANDWGAKGSSTLIVEGALDDERGRALSTPVIGAAQTTIHGDVSLGLAQVIRISVHQGIVVHVVLAAHSAPHLIGRSTAAVDGQLGVQARQRARGGSAAREGAHGVVEARVVLRQ